MLRAFRLPAVLLPLWLLVACSDGGTGPDEVRAEGIYILRTVSGGNLPFVAEQVGDYKREVTAGWITLRADQTFMHVLLLRESTAGGSASIMIFPNSGTYVQNGKELRFLGSTSSDEETGSVSGNHLTILSQGKPFVFER